MPPLPEDTAPAPPPAALDDIDGAAAPKLPAILWGLVAAAIWIVAWRVGKRWRKWPAYFVGLPFLHAFGYSSDPWQPSWNPTPRFGRYARDYVRSYAINVSRGVRRRLPW